MIREVIKYLIREGNVTLSLGLRGFQAVSGFITIYVILRYLSADAQGLYYLISSIIALQVFIELGLNNVVIQFVSHEMTKVEYQNKIFIDIGYGKKRLQSILKLLVKWYVVMGLLITIGTILFFGYYIEKNNDKLIIWPLIILFVTINVFFNGLLAFFEGSNFIKKVIKIRLLQAILSNSFLWICIYSGLEVSMSILLSMIAGFIVPALLFYRHFGSTLIDLWNFKSNESGISWKDEVFPYQWRITVSWLSGYLAFQIFIPLIYKYSGSVDAGKFGLSLQILNGFSALAFVWITVNIPQFGRLASEKNILMLKSIFKKNVIYSLVFLCIAYLVILLILFVIQKNHVLIIDRILPRNEFLVLTIAAFASHLVACQASYLRAFKKEPFVYISFVASVLTAVLGYILIPQYKISAAVIVYALGPLSFGLFFGSYIFLKAWKKEIF